jgi:hypothetical protein
MTNNPKRTLVSPSHAPIELGLLQSILEQDELNPSPSYPFDPSDPEAEAYFATLEQEVLETGWSIDDLTEQGKILATRVDQLWSSFSTPVAALTTDALTADLVQRFTARMPQQLLLSIAQQAQQVIARNVSLADQLVQCVQECLPNWGEEDLQVFARPLAFAMRSPDTKPLETTLQSVRSAEWTELSDVERARLSLAIARYAIAYVSSESDESSQS